MKKNREEVIEYIESLKEYEGYVQFSDIPIRECDVFKGFQDISLQMTKGFVSEAFFFNGTDSVAIRQINKEWHIDENKNIPLGDTESFVTPYGRITMAQVWEEIPDPLCEEMKVKKLKKVLFAGFEKGEIR
jgi:CRISPR type III-associated protein (TIGR04423 family)